MFEELYPNATPNEVTVFYNWLEANSPDLLPDEKDGDSYQQLKEELAGLWENRAELLRKTDRKRTS